jgi:cholesterol oxidase
MELTPQTRPLRRLASTRDRLLQHYDAVVVGSGYGGAIAASRLARMRLPGGSRLSVCLLERGEEIQPGEFPATPVAAAAQMQFDLPDAHVGRHTALYDFRVNEDLNAFLGCGLGGGSLVNANVSLRADPRVLADAAWPAAIRGDALDAGYALAQDMLKPRAYPDEREEPAKLRGLRRMGEANDKAVDRTPINVHFGAAGPNHVGVVQLPCTDCGDCVSGCNVSAKNTLLMNYLPDAANHGARIFTRIGVRSVARDAASGRWKVFYRLLDSGAERFDAPESFVTADRVFIAAGALGSTEIMLRSKARGLSVSDRVGQRFTGNGDILAFVYDGDTPQHPVGFGLAPTPDGRRVGPCITGVIDLRATPQFADGMVIEEGSFPSPLAPALPALLAAGAAAGSVPPGAEKQGGHAAHAVESALLGPYHGAVDRSQVLLVMSHDDGVGRMELEDDRLRVRWPGVASQPGFAQVDERLARCAQGVGGVFVKNPITAEMLGRRLVTVHALGGCAMGETAATGVVDHACRVFDAAGSLHDGLYVCDGAVIPRPLGVNPLLTISAVAERALALCAQDAGATIDYALPSAPAAEAPPETAAGSQMGIQFTETMRGFVSAGAATYEDGARDSAARSPCEFTLTVTSEDLGAMLSEPRHRASLAGTVSCPLLSDGPLTVSNGTFELLPVATDATLTRQMRYNFAITAADGRAWRFAGFKTIHDDPGLDIWPDTTTLYVDIDRDDGTRVAKGVLHILPADFAVQMSTLRVLRAPNVAAALQAKARFAKFFAGAVAETYLGVAREAPNVWPPASRDDAPLRASRALRLPPAEVHPLRTSDNVSLRLTRLRGGGKGPVMLVHGLGVASRIFTADTIDTNLAEYLVALGYDVWLLDFRASVDLPAARGQFTGDDVARFDYPAAVDAIRAATGAESVQIVAHCFGASTLFMALAAGLRNVRSAVFSQVAGHVDAPFANDLRAGLRLPTLLRTLGIDALTTDLAANPDLLVRLYDRALALNPVLRRDQHCDNVACHRISFMYAPLYQHQKLNDATHDRIGDLFGVANMSSLSHLSAMIRAGKVVASDGGDVYLPDDPVSLRGTLANFRFPIRFIHGAANECFLPSSTQRTLDMLRDAHPGIAYDREVIAGYGHIDCIFGAEAARDVYPHIAAHLDKTARP